MFNRQMHTKLPEPPNPNADPATIRWRDDEAKRKMKAYADKKAYVRPSYITEGDSVIVRWDPSYKKSATPYDPKPYIVTQQKGSMVIAARGDKAITRNSLFFKPIKENAPTDTEEEQEEVDPIPINQPISSSSIPIQQQDEGKQPQGSPQISEPGQPVSESTGRYPQRTTRCPPKYLSDYVWGPVLVKIILILFLYVLIILGVALIFASVQFFSRLLPIYFWFHDALRLFIYLFLVP